jgi:hypothetical protein
MATVAAVNRRHLSCEVIGTAQIQAGTGDGRSLRVTGQSFDFKK